MGSKVIFRYDWPIKPQNLCPWLVKLSKSNFNSWSPDFYFVHSYLITIYCNSFNHNTNGIEGSDTLMAWNGTWMDLSSSQNCSFFRYLSIPVLPQSDRTVVQHSSDADSLWKTRHKVGLQTISYLQNSASHLLHYQGNCNRPNIPCILLWSYPPKHYQTKVFTKGIFVLRTLFVLTQESDFSWPEVLATLRDVSTQWLIVLLRTSGLRRYLRSSVVPLTSAYICRSRKYTWTACLAKYRSVSQWR